MEKIRFSCYDLFKNIIMALLSIISVMPYELSADPCNNYTVLDDSRRSINYYSSSSMCDRDVSWVGWYRLYLNGQSAQMPETCVEKNMCGTAYPLWLSGGHPKPEDGVVTRDVCGHYNYYCCFYQSFPIRVKACTGGYYVYEFVTPTKCSMAYCADVSSVNSNTMINSTGNVKCCVVYSDVNGLEAV
nr:uromodulin-like [Misgurnus anguillicaudatus]